MVKRTRIRLKAILRTLRRSKKDPESMARGLGIGLFVGFLPSVGIQIFLALLMARVLSGNALAAALGTLVTNPLTSIPVAFLSLWLGNLLLPGDVGVELAFSNFSWEVFLSSPGRLGFAYLVGCLLLAIVSGILGYVGLRFYYSRRHC